METIDLSQIKTGDLGLVSSKTFLGESIQEFQEIQNKEAGKFNHGFTFIWIENVLYVIEACEQGIQLTNFQEEYINKDLYKKIIGLRYKYDYDNHKQIHALLPLCGDSDYGYFNLLVSQAIKILTRGKVWLGGKNVNPKYLICFEACAYGFDQSVKGVFTQIERIAPVDGYLNTNFLHYDIK